MQNPLFANKTTASPASPSVSDAQVADTFSPWKIALIDDEDDVISVSEMVLKRVLVDSRPLAFLKAHSAEEAKHLFEEHSDIALALVDVVMENDHAGLDLVKWIRESNKNTTTRLILRTGQPGEAPEEDVIRDYDINDYKNKTELNSTRLKTTIYFSHLILLLPASAQNKPAPPTTLRHKPIQQSPSIQIYTSLSAHARRLTLLCKLVNKPS